MRGRKVLLPVRVGNIGKSEVEEVRAIGALRKILREFRWRAHFWARKPTHSPLYTDKAKPLKETKILRTEQELRQQGARLRDRDLGTDCIERRSGNKQRGGKRGDRKKRRAAAELRRSSMLSSDAADVSRSLLARRAFTVATEPLANTPPA
eukprot:6178521-Pleurochrysis_carterae.AAC.1